MDTEEASPFESSEMLATLLASAPLISESWRLCDHANTTSPCGFVAEQNGSLGYVAFSGVQNLTCSTNLEPLHVAGDLFSPLQNQNEEDGEDEEKECARVHAGFLRIFLAFYSDLNFRSQILKILESSKSMVITGHSIGGTIASLCALWLLSYNHKISSNLQVICITFGSPLLGNESLSCAILRQRWGGNFCHVVSKYDLLPRLLFAPLSHLSHHLHSLLQFWHLSMASPHLGSLALIPDQTKAEIFQLVLVSCLQAAEVKSMSCGFWPFGNYLFCSQDGGICIENAISVIKMMHLLLSSCWPSHSIEDHLKYGDYIRKVSLQFLQQNDYLCAEELPESTYEAGVSLALQSSGIIFQEAAARDCLKLARRMGRTPNLNCANLAIKLSKITPYRSEIEWYKAWCERSEDQMGYYDSFKQRGASKKGFKVNMNRHKLARFWNDVISMLENNQLPLDFQCRAKWVYAAHSYKLLVEPLDIAEYYRTEMHRIRGHYITHGREKRYQIFDRWWKQQRPVKEEQKKTRSKFAGLTQDTCFWARVEEAREYLDSVKSEKNPINLSALWAKLDEFERYAGQLVLGKEVSIDVVAKNSSYSLWLTDYREMKSLAPQLHNQFPCFLDPHPDASS